jgi:tetratricopeptide (TPR) repeat protein
MKPNSAESIDARVLAILDEYLAERQAGRSPDRDALLARHPELAEAIAASFRALDFVHDAGRTLEASPTRPDQEAPAAAGQMLGDYRLLREIGRGGMAVVYEAEQISLDRRVALKVLPFAAVLDPKQLQRFRHEAQAAAQLQHPHIVPVHAVGCDRGVHYYAMQYIEGQSLAVAIREMKEHGGAEGHRTPISSQGSVRAAAYIRTAARLGVQAAQGLDHAHQVGIVHRDVKPGNLLVDLAGTLWITDFGLAYSRKDVGLTMTGELLGTIRYMSPEQSLAKRAPIDHRTDVYSLGVTLYEVLTLQPAFQGDDPVIVLKDIASKEPVPPRRLNPAIPRDLETVLLKSMAKDPGYRYATAQDMADDLERFLENRPIEARRAGPLRRVVKWGRRRRGVVGAAVAMLLLTVAGLATGTALLWREQAQTQSAFDRAESNLAAALDALDQVYVEEAEGNPRIRAGLPRDLLERGLRFYQRFARENAHTQHVRFLLGNAHYRASLIFRRMGQEDRATEALDRAIGAYREAIRLQLDTAFAHNNLGLALRDKGDPEGAIREFRAAVQLQPGDAKAHNNLGTALRDDGDVAGALREFREAVRLQPGDAKAHNNLGSALRDDGDLKGAIEEHREAIRLSPVSAGAHSNLGSALRDKGDLEGAIRAFGEAIRLDPDHAGARSNLGSALHAEGDVKGAIRELREAIRLQPDLADAHNNLGSALKADGDLAGGILELREAIRLKPGASEPHNNLGNALADKGDQDGAIRAYQEAIRLKPGNGEAHLGLGDALMRKGERGSGVEAYREAIRLMPGRAETHYNFGIALCAEGDWDGAIREFREAVRLRPGLAEAHYNLGLALLAKGDWDGAIRATRDALRLTPDDAMAHHNIGIALTRQGRFRDALPSLRTARRLGSSRPDWAYPSKELLRNVERMAELEASLDQVLSGELRPRSAADRVELAAMLHGRSLYAESARMYAAAFTEEPSLGEDLALGHRYRAACSASLAAARGGTVAAYWRNRAFDWLRADLAARDRSRSGLEAALQRWKRDPELAVVRDRLDEIPEPERSGWRDLWAAIDRALGSTRPTSR